MSAAVDTTWRTVTVEPWGLAHPETAAAHAEGAAATAASSLSLEVPILDAAFRQRHIAGSVSISALIMARALLSLPPTAWGGLGSVVELGAGVGAVPCAVAATVLPSTAAVCATDVDETVLDTTAACLKRNGAAAATCSALDFVKAGASDAAAGSGALAPGSVSLLLGADIVYIGSVIKPLMATAVHLLHPEHGFLFLVDPGRDSFRDQLEDAAEQAGLTLLAHARMQGVDVGEGVARHASLMLWGTSADSTTGATWTEALAHMEAAAAQQQATVQGGTGSKAFAYILH